MCSGCRPSGVHAEGSGAGGAEKSSAADGAGEQRACRVSEGSTESEQTAGEALRECSPGEQTAQTVSWCFTTVTADSELWMDIGSSVTWVFVCIFSVKQKPSKQQRWFLPLKV